MAKDTDRLQTACQGDNSDQQVVRYAGVFQQVSIPLLLLRLCSFVLDELFACLAAFPFVSPVPEALVTYHSVIKTPMDLSTLETNLLSGRYQTAADFEQDLQLIWQNARQFHDPIALIYQLAGKLESTYEGALDHITRAIADRTMNDPRSITFPEETEYALADSSSKVFNDQINVLYFLQMIAPGERSPRGGRGLSKIRDIYDQLNAPFIRYATAMANGESVESLPPFPRLYIGKNRTLLTDASTVSSSIVAVLLDAEVKPYENCRRRDLLELSSTVVLVKPVCPSHPLDSTIIDTHYTSEYLPKAFVKVKILKVYRNVKTLFTQSMEKAYLRRAYTTHRLSDNAADLKKSGDPAVASRFMQSIISGQTAITQEQVAAVDKVVVIERKRSSPSTEDTENTENTGVEKDSLPDGRAEKRHRTNISSNEMVVDTSIPSLSQSPSANEASTDQEQALVPAVKKQSSNSGFGFTQYLGPGDEAGEQISDIRTREYYLSKARALWDKVFAMCQEKNVPVIKAAKYKENTSAFPNAEGYFKHVYFVKNDPNVVVQTFRRMTITQRATEVVSLLELYKEPHMGQIVEVLQAEDGEVVGLSMQRYQKTLKQYTHMHSHHRLTAYQKMDLIQQMLGCMKSIHEKGIAHRDLSEVNFMVDENSSEALEDGTARANLRLIDFGKAIFATPDLMNKWWVEKPKVKGEYEGEVLPENDQELKDWCEHLPWIKAKPDHGYRHYRSIQTLPRSRTDDEILPYLVHPFAEDMYSIGTIIWKIFSETEPWHGILDTDLRGLRETVKDDYRIDNTLEREVSGELSRKLLRFFLRANPGDRKSAAEVLEWMNQPEIRQGLIKEWTDFAPVSRTKRHAKVTHKFEEEQSRQQRPKSNVTPSGKRRGRPPLSPEERKPGRQPTGRPRGRPKKDRNEPPVSEATQVPDTVEANQQVSPSDPSRVQRVVLYIS